MPTLRIKLFHLHITIMKKISINHFISISFKGFSYGNRRYRFISSFLCNYVWLSSLGLQRYKEQRLRL